MRSGLVGVATLILLCAEGAHGRDWAAYTTDHFTLYTDAAEDDVLELLSGFEEYRRVALAVLNLPDEPENERLKIVHPVRSSDFRALANDSNVGGFFYHREFGPRMVVAPSGNWGDRTNASTLYHEYVHYLMDQHSDLNYPPWYREGLATVLMRVRRSRTTISVGVPIASVATSRPRASLEDIVSTDYDGGVGDFYAMSWLFTHYLAIDSHDHPERKQQLADYLRRYDAGEDPIEAFVASFGEHPSAMQPELDAYRRRSTMGVYVFPRAEYTGAISKRVLDDGEELYLLGDLAAELYRNDAALDRFDRFDERHADSPLRLKVMSRRAVALVHEDRVDEAGAVVEQLIATGTEDPDVMADIAHYFHDRFEIKSGEPGADGRGDLERSIAYGSRALAGNPTDLEALFYLGRAYEFIGDFDAATDTLLRAYELTPGVTNIYITLARALFKAGYRDDAVFVMKRLESASHLDARRERYGELIEQMRAGTVDEDWLYPYPAVE